jgi:NAD(P)-dependent dehydrogenase (short-subunit alcohol dehydrogenase family)
VIAARREKEVEETAQLVKDAGSDSIFVKTDVANEDDVKALVDKTVKEYDRLDYAVNNAGFDEAETSLIEETSSDFDKIMNINVRGVWLCMKYEIPQMIQQGAGAIVNMSFHKIIEVFRKSFRSFFYFSVILIITIVPI